MRLLGTPPAAAAAAAVVAVPDGRGWMPLHYVARRGDLAFFNLLFAMTAPHLTPAAGAPSPPLHKAAAMLVACPASATVVSARSCSSAPA